MIRIVDRYLLKFFFISLLIVAVAVGLTIIVINAVEELRDFIDHDVSLAMIIEYYVYFGGWVIKSFFPMFVLLATLFSVSILARKNEILAMKASGLSLYRIMMPFFLTTLLLAGGHFYYNEFLYPQANKRRLEIKNFTIERRSRRVHNQIANIYRQIQKGHFYTIANFNVERAEGTDVRIFKTEDNRLREIITAARIEYSDYQWIAKQGVVRTFDALGESYEPFHVMILSEIQEKPADFSKRVGKPEDMGYQDLKAYIETMKRTGGPYVREAIDLDMKFSYPLSSCIVVLICIPFAASPKRGGIAVSIAVGTLISLAYFVLLRSLQSAGYNEKVPRELAVWGVNGLFLLIGLIAMLKARK